MENRFQTEGPKITFKAHAFKFRMTSDINSKVIGQPGQETDEIGKQSLGRECRLTQTKLSGQKLRLKHASHRGVPGGPQ